MSGPHQIIWSCVISLHDVNQWRNVCSRMLGSDTTIRFFCLIYICFLNGTPWEVPCSNAHELIHPELKTSSDFRFCTWFLHDINARKIAQFSGHRLPIQAVVFPSFDLTAAMAIVVVVVDVVDVVCWAWYPVKEEGKIVSISYWNLWCLFFVIFISV